MDPKTPEKIRALSVKVKDKAGLKDVATIRVKVLDKNDNVPITQVSVRVVPVTQVSVRVVAGQCQGGCWSVSGWWLHPGQCQGGSRHPGQCQGGGW